MVERDIDMTGWDKKSLHQFISRHISKMYKESSVTLSLLSLTNSSCS